MILDRQKLYEALLFWRGGMTAGRLGTIVGQTRAHVQTTIISAFEDMNRGRSRSEKRAGRQGKVLVGAPSFDHDAQDLFDLLASIRKFGVRRQAPADSIIGVACDEVRLSSGSERFPAAMLLRAASGGCCVSGSYLFKNHGVKSVVFSPHALVRTPRRLHVRGYVAVREHGKEEDWGYRDLVAGRFLDVEIMSDGAGYRDAEGDADWHKMVEVRASLNRSLPRNTFLALQQEFGLAEGDGSQIVVMARRALVHYYRHHVFDRTVGDTRMPVWEVESHE